MELTIQNLTKEINGVGLSQYFLIKMHIKIKIKIFKSMLRKKVGFFSQNIACLIEHLGAYTTFLQLNSQLINYFRTNIFILILGNLVKRKLKFIQMTIDNCILNTRCTKLPMKYKMINHSAI